MMKIVRFSSVAGIALICRGALAATWNGAESTEWTNAANWSERVLPCAGEPVTISGTAVNMPAISAGTWPAEGAYGAFVVEADATVTCLGDVTAVNEASGGTESVPHGIGVTINCTSANIAGVLTADGQGFAANKGPGGSTESAAYGGPIPYMNDMSAFYLCRSSDSRSYSRRCPYGSARAPTALGSGGSGDKGFGGGAIKIAAAGDITVSGEVRANGGDRASGGSVWLAAGGTFSGSGSVVAGSSASARSGAGGRLAITCASARWTGRLSAGPGKGYASTGGEGTLWAPWLYADKVGTAENPVEIVLTESYDYIFPDKTPHYWNIVSTNGVRASFHEGDIRAGSILLDNGSQLRFDKWSVGNMAADMANLSATNITLKGKSALALPSCRNVKRYDLAEIVIEEGSVCYVGWGDVTDANPASGGTSEQPHGSGVTIHASRAVVAGVLSASGRGFDYDDVPAPPGRGGECASHGGISKYNGTGYGRLSAPTALGSSGTADFRPLGAGGALKLEVEGDLELDGTITAEALNEKCSGGSVWIQAKNLTGAGTISANGGCTSFRPGCGGRIAVESVTDGFTGVLTVFGVRTMQSGYYAGPGTIFRNVVSHVDQFGWEADAVRLSSDYANSAGTTTLFPELLDLVTGANYAVLDDALAVSRQVTQWTKTGHYAWKETSAFKTKEDDLPNEATYRLSGLPANKRCIVTVAGARSAIRTDAAGVLTFTANLCKTATDITVDAAMKGCQIVIR